MFADRICFGENFFVIFQLQWLLGIVLYYFLMYCRAVKQSSDIILFGNTYILLVCG